MRTVVERFLEKICIEKEDDHWYWTASTRNGYGRFWDGTSLVSAHDFAYELWVDEICKDEEVDHTCRIRACLRPEHLEAVSKVDNLRRQAGWTKLLNGIWQCSRGHLLEGYNIYSYGSYTACRKCRNTRRERKGIKWQ